MTGDDIDTLISECLTKLGPDRLKDALRGIVTEEVDNDADVLTIIANKGVHHMPEYLRRGKIYALSIGSLDFSNKESVEREFRMCLAGLVTELKSREWKKIYLIPFGPTLLSALAKLVVFRVTGIQTTDVMHLEGKEYVDIDIDVRSVIIKG